MSRNKIFNDPVYGFVSIPTDIIYSIIEHPYFQRLRRIKQLSFTHYVYPGALHTRFQHALGAYHLMQQAIGVLRSKGAEISDEEARAVKIAILLHDMGHGPFSHTLESSLIHVSHEELSLAFMQHLNEKFQGQLRMAIEIFMGNYPKKYLHQLVSGQLDMDRMDYLTRDSFFTGVYEGVIGYDRIIKMLDLYDETLVVEEKGIYSIEKFLIARRLMYWQVYLHKTVLAGELMLDSLIRRMRELIRAGKNLPISEALSYFMKNTIGKENLSGPARIEILSKFATLDDFDIMMAIKNLVNNDDPVLSYLSKSLLDRKLFRAILSKDPFESDQIIKIRQNIMQWDWVREDHLKYLIISGQESNRTYSTSGDEIWIKHKNGKIHPLSMSQDYPVSSHIVNKFYICYPKDNT